MSDLRNNGVVDVSKSFDRDVSPFDAEMKKLVDVVHRIPRESVAGIAIEMSRAAPLRLFHQVTERVLSGRSCAEVLRGVVDGNAGYHSQ